MVIAPTTGGHRHRELYAAVFGELECVGQQVLEHLLQTFRVGDQTAGKVRIGVHLETQPPVFRLVAEGPATMSSRLAKKTSSASTETVPDSIFERSRMSLIRFSKSVPAP